MTKADERLVDALAQSAFRIMAHLNRAGTEHELSLTQLRVLGILRDRRLRMLGLADHLGLDKSTMSGLVDRAERRGLLVREPNADDRRATDVVMTPAGAEFAALVQREVTEALRPMLARLDREERRSLTRLLEKMLGPELAHR